MRCRLPSRIPADRKPARLIRPERRSLGQGWEQIGKLEQRLQINPASACILRPARDTLTCRLHRLLGPRVHRWVCSWAHRHDRPPLYRVRL